MTTPAGPGVVLARVYDEPERRDGDYRVLVDRLWPRGCSRAGLALDEWAKDLAPSTGLRRSYGHDPSRFAAFAAGYRAELAGPGAADGLERLRSLAGHRRVVLLTATRDLAGSGAAVLAGVLAASADRPGPGPSRGAGAIPSAPRPPHGPASA